MRGSIILFTFLLSITLLRRRQHGHHVLGVVLVLLGITVVGLAAVLHPPEGKGDIEAGKSPMVGVALILLSQLLASFQWVLEERLNALHPLHPMLAVGVEGTGGLVIGVGIVACAVASGHDSA